MSDEHNPKVMGCAGHPHRQHAEPRRARGARHDVHARLHDVPGVRAGARRLRLRQVRAPDRLLGQRRRLRRRDPELAPPAARPRPPRRLDRQAAFPRPRGRRLRLQRRADPDAHHRGQGRSAWASCATTCPSAALSWKMAAMAGPGESPYTVYDREICTRAQVWLREEAPKHRDKPWVLFVSFVCPHFPLVAPPELLLPLLDRALPLPKLYARERAAAASVSARLRASFIYDDYFDRREDVKKALCGVLRAGVASSTTTSARSCARSKRCRARGRHARALHQRPRRQPRRARTVGQVDHVRGGRGRAADRRRARRSRGQARRHAGEPRRRLSRSSWSAPARPRDARRASRDFARRARARARSRTAPSSPSTTAWARPPAPS